MSSVSSTGSDYSYYQQQVSDLENQNAKDRKKADEREDERVSNLERKYQQNLREHEDDSARAITRAKEAANSALSKERQDHKSEMARLKHETYDRFGRANSDNSAEYRQNLDELQNTLDRTEKRDRENLRATRDADSEEMVRRNQASQEEMRHALEDTKNKLSEQRENALGAAHRNYRELSDESAKRYQDLDHQRLEEMNSDRRRSNQALEESNRDSARRLEMAKKAYEKSASRQEEALRDSITEHADHLRASHDRETRGLREQMGDLLEGEKQYVKSGAQGRADAVNDYENDWRRRLDTQGSSYERQISDLKSQNDRTESSLSHQNYENMRDREAFLARTLAAQTQKHHQDMRNAEKGFERDEAQMVLERKHDNELRDKMFHERLARVSSENQHTLNTQAETLNASAERQRQSDRQELKQAEASLHEQRTSADTALISPAAEASMRRQIAGQYAKTAQADQLRNQRETSRLRDEYKQQFSELLDSDRNKDARVSRQVTSERDQDRARFGAHVADLEYMKDSALSEQEKNNAQETDKLTKSYARLMSHRDREHEEQLDAFRGSASSKIDALRDESEFDRKMAIREFNDRQNRLTHDYEKKLADQKTQYEDQLADQKAAFDSTSREKERQYRNTLDRQGRAYEHRIAQQDAQFKERERFLNETFQDRIDKLKRSNQLLIQRRS